MSVFFPSIVVKEEVCPECNNTQNFTMSRICGVYICDECGHHLTLARCFCGWNLQPGEQLEDDVDY
jgi:predicted amidophosphoribosyltransferase